MQIYKYRFLKQIIAFVKDKHEERSIIARFAVAVGATPPSVR